jgi:hypothetical protein
VADADLGERLVAVPAHDEALQRVGTAHVSLAARAVQRDPIALLQVVADGVDDDQANCLWPGGDG